MYTLKTIDSSSNIIYDGHIKVPLCSLNEADYYQVGTRLHACRHAIGAREYFVSHLIKNKLHNEE